MHWYVNEKIGGMDATISICTCSGATSQYNFTYMLVFVGVICKLNSSSEETFEKTDPVA